eukprot:EG_transcript_26899
MPRLCQLRRFPSFMTRILSMDPVPYADDTNMALAFIFQWLAIPMFSLLLFSTSQPRLPYGHRAGRVCRIVFRPPLLPQSCLEPFCEPSQVIVITPPHDS